MVLSFLSAIIFPVFNAHRPCRNDANFKCSNGKHLGKQSVLICFAKGYVTIFVLRMLRVVVEHQRHVIEYLFSLCVSYLMFQPIFLDITTIPCESIAESDQPSNNVVSRLIEFHSCKNTKSFRDYSLFIPA